MSMAGRISITVLIALAASVWLHSGAAAQPADAKSGTTLGMRRYADGKYGFAFWYPEALKVKASAIHDTKSFPGGTLIATLQVGPAGGVAIHVVDSRTSTITDEPNGHAAPIPQTKYFYDMPTQRWMIAYPEGAPNGQSSAPVPAKVTQKTIGGLPRLPAGARFDTTIIPLSTTRFIVVQDGGGASFTAALAQTVTPVVAQIDPAALTAALQAEAAAYKKQ